MSADTCAKCGYVSPEVPPMSEATKRRAMEAVARKLSEANPDVEVAVHDPSRVLPPGAKRLPAAIWRCPRCGGGES